MPRTKSGAPPFWAALVLSAVLIHPAVGIVFHATRSDRIPRLTVEREGEGSGVVIGMVTTGGGQTLDCGERCDVMVEAGTVVRLVATVDAASTFAGWDGPCGSQSHRLFLWSLYAMGSRLSEMDRDLVAWLADSAVKPRVGASPLECDVTVHASTHVRARFGRRPNDVMVTTVVEDRARDVALPEPTTPVAVPKPLSPRREEAKPLPPLVAATPPQPKPKPEETQEKVQPKPEAKPPNQIAVEVEDKHEVDVAPNDARFLSDKNRDVAEETRATETNLEKMSDGESTASSPSELESREIGGAEAEIAQLENTEPLDLEIMRPESGAHGGDERQAVGAIVGRRGDDGGGGDNGMGDNAKPAGLLAMRGSGAGSTLGGLFEPDRRTGTGKPGSPGREGTRGVRVPLGLDDYERIVGSDKAIEESRLSKRKYSAQRGRWERKLGAIKSSLENFTPSVKPGNQTALKTRAAPFAVYIAGMHRRIHELWGFGFLEDIDRKGSDHELNNWDLVVNIEISINADGSVDQMVVARTSGSTTFDVAAMDAVMTAGPFESPPEAIRSDDGKTYMHWHFHRDWRQCSTAGVDPFILDRASKQRSD